MAAKRMRQKLVHTVLGTLAAVAALAAPAHAVGPDPVLFATLLDEYTRATDDVAGTRVDYAGLRGEARWKTLVDQLEASDPSELTSREAKLAFWVNAYNILAIQTVLDGYPLESIRDLGSFFSPVWKREAGTIGGKVVTLHEVEHEILRPMGDPRIHAAIVCASTSCPSLSRVPYSEAGIDAELDRAMQTFLADPRKGMKIDREADEVTLSKIFDWFEEDFAAGGGVIPSITPLAPEADRAWLRKNPDADVEYFDYDWRLNDTTPPAQRR